MDKSGIVQFLKADIWRVRENELSRVKSIFLRSFRVLVLSLRGLTEDKCQLRASALTFYSLLSVVPVVAMIFGIAKGFGFEKALERQVLLRLEGQEEVATRVIGFAQALLEDAKGGIIAGVGLLILLWTGIKVLSNIEKSFNDIWGVKKGRSFGRKISDYLSLMIICPILLVMSSAVTVLIASQIQIIVQKISLLGPVSSIIFFMLNFLPYCVIWVLFTFIYMFMPNTTVGFKSALLAGVIAGTGYQVFQWGYINLQIGVAKYNAIYGSFAVLPLFLVWLQISWLIVLFGAEISFAHQNVDTCEFEPDCRSISPAFKRLLTLRIVHFIVKHFSEGDNQWDEVSLSRSLEIPVHCVRQILNDTVEAGILSEVSLKDERTFAYQPARDTDSMTLKYVIHTIDSHGISDIPVAESPELKEISECLKDFEILIENSPSNRLLKDL